MLSSAGKSLFATFERTPKDSSGYVIVSPSILAMVKTEIPEELIELVPQADGWAKMRLSDKGQTVQKYLL
jgi:hypothetical protein